MTNKILQELSSLNKDTILFIATLVLAIISFLISVRRKAPFLVHFFSTIVIALIGFVGYLNFEKSKIDEKKSSERQQKADSTIADLSRKLSKVQSQNGDLRDQIKELSARMLEDNQLQFYQSEGVLFSFELVDDDPDAPKPTNLDEQIFGSLFKRNRKAKVVFKFNTVQGNISFGYTRINHPDSCFSKIITASYFDEDSFNTYKVAFKNNVCSRYPDVMYFKCFLQRSLDTSDVKKINATQLFRFISDSESLFSIHISDLNSKLTEQEITEIHDKLVSRFTASVSFDLDDALGLSVRSSLFVDDSWADKDGIYISFKAEKPTIINKYEYLEDGCWD